MRTIAAGLFKAQCLRLLDEVAETGKTIVVTKRGKPVAKVEPLEDPPPLKGRVAYSWTTTSCCSRPARRGTQSGSDRARHANVGAVDRRRPAPLERGARRDRLE